MFTLITLNKHWDSFLLNSVIQDLPKEKVHSNFKELCPSSSVRSFKSNCSVHSVVPALEIAAALLS